MQNKRMIPRKKIVTTGVKFSRRVIRPVFSLQIVEILRRKATSLKDEGLYALEKSKKNGKIRRAAKVHSLRLTALLKQQI